MVLVQAPDQVAALAHDAVRRSRRAVTGFSGRWPQVVAARAALGLAAAPAVQDSRDDLYALDLDRLVVPKPLASGEVRCRHPEPEELDLLVQWRASFAVESLGATDGPDLRRASQADVHLLHERRRTGPSVAPRDRKSTRLNSSHTVISYAVFCLKKKHT